MDRDLSERTILGLVEKVTFYGDNGHVTCIARIDTGATSSSLDTEFAKKLGLGPVTRYVEVKQAAGRSKRPVKRAQVTIAGKDMNAEFTLADRKLMRYKALIGQNILKKGFLIDPSKK